MSVNVAEIVRDAIRDAVNQLLDEYDIRSCCINCVHFSELNEFCKLTVPASRPPARVITFGCPSFKDIDS